MNSFIRGIRLKLACLACATSIIFLIHANLTAERSIKIKTRSIREQISNFYENFDDKLHFNPISNDVNGDYEETTQETTTDNGSTFTTTSSTTTTTNDSPSDGSNESTDGELPLCEKYPDTLIGRILPNTSLEIDWDEVSETVEDGLLPGGCWEPTDCKPRAKTAIIVPYKDRETHLKRLLFYLHPFLQRQKIAYCIVVAEQFHDGRFNKGILMNAAYNELMKLDDFDCVVFHDVDMLPEDDRNTYACGHVPTHLSLMINKYNYRYPYGTDFGGVTMMSALNYSEVNGHTNVFWGWGREDSDIEHRIHAKHMKIEKPEIFDSARYSMCGHAHPWTFQNEKHKEAIENSYQAVTHKMLMKLKYWRNKNDGLNSLQYSMRLIEKKPLYTHLMIESRLLVPKTIKMDQKKQNLIEINYDETGLQKEDNCKMVEFKNSGIRSNALDGIIRKTELSRQKCLDIGVFCQGMSPDDSITAPSEKEYHVRELPLLRSHDNANSWIKNCPGNLAYYQLSLDPIEFSGMTADEANHGEIEINYTVTAEVNFNKSDQIWYRDSQLFESYQVNEFSTEIVDASEDETITSNKIRWIDDSNVEISVTVVVPKRIPGYYTILSKMVDVLGQPVLEFNWNFHVTTGNFEVDKKIRESIKHNKYERLGGQKIASMWGRSIMNAVKRKGLENIDFTFDAEELKSPAEKRAEMRGQLKK